MDRAIRRAAGTEMEGEQESADAGPELHHVSFRLDGWIVICPSFDSGG
jgi:hypothetical protein